MSSSTDTGFSSRSVGRFSRRAAKSGDMPSASGTASGLDGTTSSVAPALSGGVRTSGFSPQRSRTSVSFDRAARSRLNLSMSWSLGMGILIHINGRFVS